VPALRKPEFPGRTDRQPAGQAGADHPQARHHSLEASTDGDVAELEGFPDPAAGDITMKSLQIGSLQPSRQGVVAW
jgi:hypothetical protein